LEDNVRLISIYKSNEINVKLHPLFKSVSFVADIDRVSNDLSNSSITGAPKFIKDTTAYWYKPEITRDQVYR